MRGRIIILAAVLGAAVVLFVVLNSGGGGQNALRELQRKRPAHKVTPPPGAPSVAVIAPRDGYRQTAGAVMVRVLRS